MTSWAQRPCLPEKEKLLLPIAESRDVCFILPQGTPKQWATVPRENSREAQKGTTVHPVWF